MKPIYKIMFLISVAVMLASLVLFFIYGLNLGIDFTGGALLEVRSKNLEVRIIRDSLEKLGISNAVISRTDDQGFLIKMSEISEDQHQRLLAEFGKIGEFEEKRFDSIGSVLGQELKRKSIAAIIIALVAISLYLALVFRRIGQMINPFVLALSAIVALLHDLLLPIGVFVLLGKFQGVALDAPLIAAALAILGYSINDTVVVYDRIRENLIMKHASKAPWAKGPLGASPLFGATGLYGETWNMKQDNFSQIVHRSIKQTLGRSINTTLTTLFAVLAIYIFGGVTLKSFSLALIIGIASGAYSSIFVASPILMMLHRRQI